MSSVSPPDSVRESFCLPRASLLAKPWEFELVYRQGTRVRGEGFHLIFRANDKDWSRIGISVNRSIKGAVKRNRIKRLIRECFRLNKALIPLATDVVFTVRPEFSLHRLGQVEQALKKALFKKGRGSAGSQRQASAHS